MNKLYPNLDEYMAYKEPEGWWRHLGERVSVARKEHECFECGEAIRIGKQFKRSTDILDGQFSVGYWHIACYLKFMGGAQ